MMNKNYETILHLPHPISTAHPQMPPEKRAAQFAPFAALTGLEELFAEQRRQTQTEIFPDEGEIAAVDRQLRLIQRDISRRPRVRLCVFYPDERKRGGTFRTFSDAVVRIDPLSETLTLAGGERVEFCRILRLESDMENADE